MTPMQDEEQKPAGLVGGARAPEPEMPEAEDAEEPGEPPEDTPADVVEDKAEGEDEGAEGSAPDAAKAQIEAHIPPQFQSAVERLVLAGMKAMFDPRTHQLMLDELRSQGDDLGKGAAVGIAALISQLLARVKGEMPQPAIVPAALILLMEALSFLDEAGQIEATPDVVAEATQDLAGYLMQKLGLTPDKVKEAQAVFAQQGGMGGPMPDEGGAPPMPAAPGEGAPMPDAPPEEPAGGGLIQRARRV